MSDSRVVGTEDLLIMNRQAKNAGLTYLTPAMVERLDPDGGHVLFMRLWGHNVERPGEKLWHRVGALLKVKDSTTPYETTLEVFDEPWKRLKGAEEYVRELTEEQA
jgi:hypothetical protein